MPIAITAEARQGAADVRDVDRDERAAVQWPSDDADRDRDRDRDAERRARELELLDGLVPDQPAVVADEAEASRNVPGLTSSSEDHAALARAHGVRSRCASTSSDVERRARAATARAPAAMISVLK